MGRNGSSSSACPPGRQHQPGRGERFTNWVHRDDAAAAAIAALDGLWQGVVNVVDDAPVSLAELLNATLAQAGLEAITWQPASESGTPGLDRRISNRLLKRRGFELSHPRIALLNGDGAPQRAQTSTTEPTSPQP